MIVLDADVLLVDMRYDRDSRFLLNRQVLNQLRASPVPLAITSHTLLEILGVSSFNLSRQGLLELADQIPVHYALDVFPSLEIDPAYACLKVTEIRDRIAIKLSVGDAVTGLQIERFVPQATLFLSWNARHFRSKLAIPVLTPDEWWQQNQPTS